MNRIFNPDSKWMRAMSRLADLAILNLCFLITCVPVFTIGAALTAMYTVCFRFGTKREDGVVKPYFRAFRNNFKQATILWLILFLALGLTLGDAYICYNMMPGALHYTFILFTFFFLMMLFTFCYAFPLLSQFENNTRTTLKNALLLSVGYLPRTVIIAALTVIPFYLLWANMVLFFQVGFIWIVLYFSTVAYFASRLLKKPFAPYMPEEPDDEEDNIDGNGRERMESRPSLLDRLFGRARNGDEDQ